MRPCARVAQLVERLRSGVEAADALVSPAHQACWVIVPRGHVLSTFELVGTMPPGGSVSDAVDRHVATVIREDLAKVVARCNLKLGELLTVACDRVFVIPGDVPHKAQCRKSVLCD